MFLKNYRAGDFRATFHSPDTDGFKRIFSASLPDLPGVIYAVSKFRPGLTVDGQVVTHANDVISRELGFIFSASEKNFVAQVCRGP